MTLIQKDRLPPHDLDAEEAVLGSLLIDPEAIHKVVWLKAEHFYREKNRWAYECCQSIYERKEAINQITVAHELARHQQLEAAGGAAYMSHLVSQVPTSVHVEYYGDIVKKLAVKRLLISTFNQVADMAYDSAEPEDVIAKTRELIDKVAGDQRKTSLITPSEWVSFAEERYESLLVKEGSKVRFGIPWLDLRTGGAHNSRLIIVGARPMVGKTTLIMQFAVHAGISNHVLLASAEESIEDITDRLAAAATGLPIVKVNTGNYDEETYELLKNAARQIGECGIFIYSEGGITTAKINSVAKQAMAKHGLDAIYVDYLQLLRDRYGNNLNERVSHISAELKDIARSLDIPVIVACQLNRGPEHGDKIPRLHELRDSGSIEQDADLVLFLYRADAYLNFNDPDCPPGQAKIYIAKQRHGGKIGKCRLRWNDTAQRYDELETIHTQT